MTIGTGTRVGVYEIREQLGEGGMGAVFRASDSRLQRDVAIKVIRRDLAEDTDHAARFDREARLLASLNHPNIAVVHGLEHAGDVRLLVLELVPGDTLAERLRKGPLAVAESLGFAIQIASGIEAAHDRGIVHRDLKPANIKITPSGSVKILDFGLAKALATDPDSDVTEGSPTITAEATGEGVILGTAAFMSPEQARGKEIDKRADIWAFGCVLYDMLVGRTPFAAETVSDTIVAILTREPDWSRLPADTPPAARRLLQRCLQKDASRRLRDIGDAKLDLEEALSWKPSTEAIDIRPSGNRRQPVFALVGALLIGAVLSAAAIWALRPITSAPRSTAQFAVALPENEPVGGLDFPAVVISPNDTHIVYVARRGGRSQLFARAIESLEAHALTGTEGALGPFFSPDGRWVGFFAGGALKKVPITGGAVRTITEAQIGFGASWGSDNTIVFAPNNASELWRVSADGGKAEPVTRLDSSRGEFSHRWPEILPDGKSVLFTVGTEGSWDDAVIAMQTIGSTDRRSIVQGGTSPRFSATGHLLYSRAGVLHALPFDGRQQQGHGEAVSGVGRIFQSSDGAAQFSSSNGASLVYVPASGSDAEKTLVWVDRDGHEQPLAAPPRAFGDPRLSFDDRHVAVTISDATRDVWTYDIGASRLEQFTFEGGTSPVWCADGSRLLFAANRGGSPDIFSKLRGENGIEERLTRTPRTDVPASCTRDGTVLFVESDGSGRDIALLSSDRTPRPLVVTEANEAGPTVSPDGGLVAYVSDTSGRPEVYVAAMTDPGRATQVSTDGGTEPAWKRDSSELFFRSGSRMMTATVRTRPSLSVQSPRQLFTGAFETGAAWRAAYDVSRDGSRFLMIRSAPRTEPGRELRILLGWKPD